MKGKFYLDYAKDLRVDFVITEAGIQCELICESNNKRLSEKIVNNLKEISTIRYIPNKDIFRYEIKDNIFVDISRTTGEIKYHNKLISFETRLLGQGKNNAVPFDRSKLPSVMPKTDLHTHFAGAIQVDDLIEIGLKYNIAYPIEYLKLFGINTDVYENDNNGNIYLRKLTETDLKIVKNNLKLPCITQETFLKMEEIYKLRGPFTKDENSFPDYLRCLAEDYKAMGIKYVESSFSTFMKNPKFMQMLEDHLPIIEKETGVKIRFVTGMWRHNKKELNLDEIDILKALSKSPYIVGCDIMGQEYNASLAFEEELKVLARHAMMNDPNFVIRVHAGENPIFKSNVYDALKIIYDEHKKLEAETGQKIPMPKVRIGHGVYGLDITSDGRWNAVSSKDVLNLIKEMDAIIEINMSSNLALNNIDALADVPIKKYLDAGVKVVLGSDGHGLYSTSMIQEVILAVEAGLTEEDFKKIIETENYVIKNAYERELKYPTINDVLGLYRSIKYSTPDGNPRYTAEVRAKYAKQHEEYLNMLKRDLKQANVIVDNDLISEATKDKTPILITGASASSWPIISPEHQEYIKLTMQVLANVLNPDKTFIVTGGTNFGAEKTMHEAVNRRNKNSDNPMVLLGTLTMEATRKGAVEVEPNTITHGTILEIDGHMAEDWMELPDTQLIYAQQLNGEVIAVGGGDIVKNMIQRAHNNGMKLHLMDGPAGASTIKSKSMAGNNYSFKTIEDLLKRLYNSNPNLFIEGFSLDNAIQYIYEAQKMIDNESELENDNINIETHHTRR